MKKKKLVTIISGIERSLGMENYIRLLSKDKYDHTVVLIHSRKGEIASALEKEGINVMWIRYLSKRDLIHAFRTLVNLLKKLKPDIVHTHLFEAAFFGIHAARYCRVAKRISTRHHSSFHHVYHPKAVKYDKWINASSTHIISISETVSKILTERENVDPGKIKLIHHGFDQQLFTSANEKSTAALKTKYSLSKEAILVGMIARATEWKGIQYAIDAVKTLITSFPTLTLLIGNLEGEFKSELLKKLSQLPANSYRILSHEREPSHLYKLFDYFIHVPVDDHSEAFGQVYVEAMAAGKPCIFTLSGIGNLLCEHEKNCLVVNYRDVNSIANALQRLLKDNELKDRLGWEARRSVEGKFDLHHMVRQLEEVYDN